MRDSRGGRHWIATMFASLIAAFCALGVSNLSCGSVASNVCAQEACPDVSALESRLTELERRIQPLFVIAQLQCGVGSVLAWSGTAWGCTKTIEGDLTITGSATIGRELIVTGAAVRLGETSMNYSRATFGRLGTKIQYSKDGTLIQELDIGDGTQALGGGANAYIQYAPGGVGGSARLLFNIDKLRTLNCVLFHDEDDFIVFGLAFATDGGNNYMDAWGGVKSPPSFSVVREWRPM